MRLRYDPNANLDVFAPQPPFVRTDKSAECIEPFWGNAILSQAYSACILINATDQAAAQFKLLTPQTLTKVSFFSDNVVAAGTAVLNVYADDGTGAPTGASLGNFGAGVVAQNFGVNNLTGSIALNAGNYVAVITLGGGTSFDIRGGGGSQLFDGFGLSVKTGGVWIPMIQTHHGWQLEFSSGLKYGLPAITGIDSSNGVGRSTAKIFGSGAGVMIGLSGLADCAQLIHGATFELGFVGVQPAAGITLRGYKGTDGSALGLAVESQVYTKTPMITSTAANTLITNGTGVGIVTLRFPSPMIVANGQRWAMLVACSGGDASNYFQLWANKLFSSSGNIGNQSQLEKIFGFAPLYAATTATIADPNASPWTEGCPWMRIHRMLR